MAGTVAQAPEARESPPGGRMKSGPATTPGRRGRRRPGNGIRGRGSLHMDCVDPGAGKSFTVEGLKFLVVEVPL
jgi:hypothetical protein